MDLERVRDLERLATLHGRGELTDEEFADAKAQVLARGDTPRVQSPAANRSWVAPVVLVTGVTIVAILVALAVSRGGGDRLTVAEYEQATLDAHGEALSTLAQDRLRPREARAAILDLADDLDELEPPRDARDGHDQLVAAYREHIDAVNGLVGLVDAATDAAADPSRREAAELGLSLLGSGRALLAARRDLSDARAELARAGVDVVTLAHPGKLLRNLA